MVKFNNKLNPGSLYGVHIFQNILHNTNTCNSIARAFFLAAYTSTSIHKTLKGNKSHKPCTKGHEFFI
jgi:hypothetical protein